MAKIHCIGDSHVSVFSGLNEVGQNYDALPFFKTYWLGPHTAYHAMDMRDTIDALVTENVKPGDRILLCFGEIDCRVHLLKQSELRKEPLEDIVRECVARYFKVFLALKGQGYDLIAWNVPPPSVEDIEYYEYSTYGSYPDRLKVTRMFNNMLEEHCAGSGIPFISIFEQLLGPDGLTNPLHFMDEIHLSQRSMPLIMEAFKAGGIDLGSCEEIPDNDGYVPSGEDVVSVAEDTGTRAPDHQIINVVYGHLAESQMHAFCKGNASVVWSAVPLKGCDLYAYLNAFSFMGKQDGLDVLLLWEPYVVLPGQWDDQVWAQFDRIFTLYKALERKGPNFRRVRAPRSGWVVPVDVTEDREERERKYPLKDRRNAICMINGHKISAIPGELYSKRFDAAKWFHENSDIPFDIYGTPPFPLPNYIGALDADRKLPTMAGYMYSLCFENLYHPAYSSGYITEKILDCLETRTVPIYFGCSDIERYIPKDCFIDFRDFKDFSDLNDFLANMSRKRYKKYTHSIDQWVMEGNLRQYSWQVLYDELVSLLDETAGRKSASVEERDGKGWISGISPVLKDRQWVPADASGVWSYETLAATIPPVVEVITGEEEAGHDLMERLGEVSPVPEERALKLQKIKSADCSLKADFLKKLHDAFDLDVFVETGTDLGNTTDEAQAVFDEVHAIELSRSLYEKAEDRFKGRTKVHVYHGDAVSQLPNVLTRARGRKALLWLDAHYSEGVTGAGAKNTSIIEEITLIKDLTVKNEMFFLIDDIRFCQDYMGATPEDPSLSGYPTVARVCDAILGIDDSFQFAVMGDVLLAYRKRAGFRVSPVLHACTVSRLFEGANFPEEQVFNAEQVISEAEGIELRAVQSLVKDNLESENLKIGGHYRLWHGLTLWGRKLYDEACLEFLTAMQTGVRHWRLYWYIARSAFMADNPVLARNAANAALNAAPGFKEARKLLEDLDMGVAESPDAKGTASGGHLASALFFQNEGRFPEAIGAMEKVISTGVADANVHYQYAQLLIVTGQYDRSVGELKKVVALNPRHTFAHNDLGVIYQQKELFYEAIAAFEKSVSSDNGNYNALRNLLRLFLMRDRRDGAMRVARMLMTDRPWDKKLKDVVKEFDLPLGTSATTGGEFESIIFVKDADSGEEGLFRKKAGAYYGSMKEIFGLDSSEGSVYRFVHPVWKEQLDTLGALISDGLPDNFLYHPICLEMFVRAGWQPQQQHELEYLEGLEGGLKERIFSIQETQVGLLPRNVPGHDISINTLGMLWYCARIEETLAGRVNTVVEFGGGFGSFARVFTLFADGPLTYIIIDLPEMLALQLYYLGLSLGADKVVAHTDTAEAPRPGKINLYPVYGLEEMNITSDLFVSTFALSETPAFTQDMVCKGKKFFNASHIYITGQLETERLELGWQRPQDIVLSALHQYKHMQLDHFHIGHNYELRAHNDPGDAVRVAGRISPAAPLRSAEGGIPENGSQAGRDTVAVVFSKDRAMQLHCTLASLMLHCRDVDGIDVRVLYTTSHPMHEAQYEKLKKDFPSVRFVKEGPFKDDLLSLISAYRYVLFLVDDNIFVRDFEVKDAIDALDSIEDAIGFSLRLGTNTTYCYMLNRAQALPQFQSGQFQRVGNRSMKFDWTTAECDFGYPLEVSSSVYRVPDLLGVMQLYYRNPNTLELMLDKNKHLFRENRKSLLCFERSVTFCNPVNMVQTMWINRAGGESDYSAGKLADMFDKGLRVDVKAYSGFVPNSCHQEVVLKFSGEREEPARPVGDKGPLVSIMIISYNGIDHIRTCLESIKRNTPEDHEIVVVDNARNDGSLDFVRSVPGVVVIENPTNIGYSPARAQAMSVVRGRYIVSLDDDTVVSRGWVTRFIEHSEAHPELGIIGPRSNYVSGPQIVTEARYNNIAEMEEFAEAWSREHEGHLTPANKLIGFCMFIPRKVLERIGCIDYNFGKLFGFDDDDYSLRAQAAGFRLAIADDIFIHHTGGPQGKGNPEYNELLMGAWEMFKTKWRLPRHLKYGEPYNIQAIISEPFDQKRHYTPPLDPASVLRLVRGEEGMGAKTAAWYHELATKMQEEGNTDEAVKNLEIVLKMDPSYPDVNNDLGVLYYQLGEAEKALGFMEKAVELDPDSADSLRNKADMCLELGKVEEAVEAYAGVLAMEPENIDTLLIVGNLNAQADRFEDAMMFYRKVLEIEGENPVARQSIDLIESRMGEQRA